MARRTTTDRLELLRQKRDQLDAQLRALEARNKQAGRVGDRGLHVLDVPPEIESGWHVEEDFIAAVKSKGRVRPRPNFEEGVRYMRVVQAVADSRARNQWVEVKM